MLATMLRKDVTDQAFGSGDIFNTMEGALGVIDGSISFSATAAQLMQDGVISGGAAINLTLPSADAMIKALSGSQNLITPPANALYGPTRNVELAWPANISPIAPGSSFRRILVNNNSATVTMVATAATGQVLTAPTTIITVNWREYLVRILNSSPARSFSATTTNASKVLSNISQTDILNLSPGMSVTGTGIGAAPNKIVAVNIDAGTVTVEVNSSATADNILVAATPTIIWQGIRSGTA